MTTLTRRHAVLVGLTGLVSIQVTSTAHAQNAPASVSGRAIDYRGDPAKKLKCYLSGSDNVPFRGTFEDRTGKFAFNRTPKGPVLQVDLHYNGEVFPYPVMNPSQQSHLEVRFPLTGTKWGSDERPLTTSGIVNALGSIASFAMKLVLNKDLRTDFLRDESYADTKAALTAIGEVVRSLPFTIKEEEKLVDDLYANTVALWNTLR